MKIMLRKNIKGLSLIHISAWRQKTLNETGSDQYGPHSLTVERIEMAIALHIECALINEYGEAQDVYKRQARAAAGGSAVNQNW